MSSSLPRHDARLRTKTQKQKQWEQKDRERKHKGRLQVSTKKYKKNLYDAWTDKCHDACSNAVITSSI